MTRCRQCHTAPVVGASSQSAVALAKAQYCAACRAQKRRRPASTVTPAQAAQLAQMVGQVPQEQICAQVGLSKANVTRWIWENGYASKHWNAYPPEIIEAVCAAYAALGKVRTQALFPDVRVQSITDRYYTLPPRQTRWTGEQLIEAIRMAGLVSATAQAHWFGRPNAYDGSIGSLWHKHLRCSPRDLHGLAAGSSWALVTSGCPATLVAADRRAPGPRSKVLWLDLATWLRAEVDAETRGMVGVMAAWQAWLLGTEDTNTIRRWIAAREEGQAMALTVGTNGKSTGQTGFATGGSVLPVQRERVEVVPQESEEIFNAKGVVKILENLMRDVTAQEVTPATVQSAVLAANAISNLLRVHLEAERLRRSDRR